MSERGREQSEAGVKVICLPHGITVEVGPKLPDQPGYEWATIESDLHTDDDDPSDPNVARYNGAVDGLESFILAAVQAGMDVVSPAFLEALNTAVDGISSWLGE